MEENVNSHSELEFEGFTDISLSDEETIKYVPKNAICNFKKLAELEDSADENVKNEGDFSENE